MAPAVVLMEAVEDTVEDTEEGEGTEGEATA